MEVISMGDVFVVRLGIGDLCWGNVFCVWVFEVGREGVGRGLTEDGAGRAWDEVG